MLAVLVIIYKQQCHLITSCEDRNLSRGVGRKQGGTEPGGRGESGFGEWGAREVGEWAGSLRRRRTPSLLSLIVDFSRTRPQAQAIRVVQADVKLWGQGPSDFHSFRL